MLISEGITIIREDYLDDTNATLPLWSDASLLRRFNEAERQACNRADLIYDNTTVEYTRITLVSGQASYTFSSKITVIENVIFEGAYITKTSQDNLDLASPTWRTDTTMTDNDVSYFIKGRKITFSRIPDATDAGKYVYLEVYRLPDTDITSVNQEPEIPAENHPDLIYWVLHSCYKKQDADTYDQEKSDYYLGRFTEIFGPPVSAKVRQHQLENPRSMMLIPKAASSSLDEVDNDW